MIHFITSFSFPFLINYAYFFLFIVIAIKLYLRRKESILFSKGIAPFTVSLVLVGIMYSLVKVLLIFALDIYEYRPESYLYLFYHEQQEYFIGIYIYAITAWLLSLGILIARKKNPDLSQRLDDTLLAYFLVIGLAEFSLAANFGGEMIPISQFLRIAALIILASWTVKLIKDIKSARLFVKIFLINSIFSIFAVFISWIVALSLLNPFIDDYLSKGELLVRNIFEEREEVEDPDSLEKLTKDMNEILGYEVYLVCNIEPQTIRELYLYESKSIPIDQEEERFIIIGVSYSYIQQSQGVLLRIWTLIILTFNLLFSLAYFVYKTRLIDQNVSSWPK